MEDRKDLLTLLLDGLESEERNHVERAILRTTNQKYARLRRDVEPEPELAV
jgi:hypothetical protein